ncbi:MAG: efflux RND transporter periplasmic adaptor subunit, partial [Bacteroidetes bacterium]
MKSILSTFVLLALLVACQAPAEEGSLPESLEEKRSLLREKQKELQRLKIDIAELEAAILAQDPDAQKANPLVRTQRVEKGDFSSYVTLQGSVAADALVGASAEIGGRVTQLLVKEGDNVRRGQLVAVIDVEALEKQRAELVTSLDLATTVYERQKRLWEQNIGSEIQFLQAKNNKERLEKSLEVIDVQLTKNKVYAPISGVVERELVQAGELASPGMPIVQILNTNELKVVADVPENYINVVSPDKRIKVTVPALEMEKILPISLIGKTVDPANRTFK